MANVESRIAETHEYYKDYEIYLEEPLKKWLLPEVVLFNKGSLKNNKPIKDYYVQIVDNWRIRSLKPGGSIYIQNLGGQGNPIRLAVESWEPNEKGNFGAGAYKATLRWYPNMYWIGFSIEK